MAQNRNQALLQKQAGKQLNCSRTGNARMSLIENRTDTIVALATPKGASAICVVRLSGADAMRVCGCFLKPLKNTPLEADTPCLEDKKASLMEVRENGRLVDKVIAVYHRAPRSFTGEDTVEMSCHGSPYIAGRIISLALEAGARTARPGEFTLRAFLNGKMDLSQAEGVSDLIQARTEAAHRAAVNQVEGEISARITRMKRGLISALAELEARLDDSDEEIPPLDREKCRSALRLTLLEIRSLADSFRAGRIMKEGLRVSIVGAPNCGKSSLLNRLLGCARAIVSPAPGTTRDTVEEAMSLEGQEVLLVDTAGIRSHCLDPAEKEGMERTKKAIAGSDLVIWLCDASAAKNPGNKAAEEEINRHLRPGIPLLKVFNKSDLAPGLNTAADGLLISCRTGAGLDELKTCILAAFAAPELQNVSCVITSARHHEALTRAGKETEEAVRVLGEEPAPLEIGAFHLKSALGELESIAGETAPEEILSEIFSRFCVGK